MAGFTYPFPNFNDASIDAWEFISNFIIWFQTLLGMLLIIKASPCW